MTQRSLGRLTAHTGIDRSGFQTDLAALRREAAQALVQTRVIIDTSSAQKSVRDLTDAKAKSAKDSAKVFQETFREQDRLEKLAYTEGMARLRQANQQAQAKARIDADLAKQAAAAARDQQLRERQAYTEGMARLRQANQQAQAQARIQRDLDRQKKNEEAEYKRFWKENLDAQVREERAAAQKRADALTQVKRAYTDLQTAYANDLRAASGEQDKVRAAQRYREALVDVEAELKRLQGQAGLTNKELLQMASIERSMATSRLAVNGVQNPLSSRIANFAGALSPSLGAAAMNTQQTAAAFTELTGVSGKAALGLGLVATAAVGAGAALWKLGSVGLDQIKILQGGLNVLQANGVKDLYTVEKQVASLKTELGTVGKSFTRAELTASTADLVKAGIDVSGALNVMAGGARLAAAENTNLNDANMQLLKNLRQYGLDTDQASKVTDMFAKAGNLAAGSANDLSLGFGKVGGTGKQAGIEMFDLLGMLVELDNKGMSAADVGADALRTALSSLADPSEKAKGILHQLNIELKDHEGKARPAGDILKELGQKMRGMGIEYNKTTGELQGNGQALATVAGLMDTRAAAAVINLTGDWRDYGQQIKDSKGYADEYANTMTQGVEPAQKRLKTAVEDTGAAFMKSFAGPLADFLDKTATPMVEKLGLIFEKLTSIQGMKEIKASLKITGTDDATTSFLKLLASGTLALGELTIKIFDGISAKAEANQNQFNDLVNRYNAVQLTRELMNRGLLPNGNMLDNYKLVQQVAGDMPKYQKMLADELAKNTAALKAGAFGSSGLLPSDKASSILRAANALGVNPNDLAAAISFETAGTFSTNSRNPTSSATGLIQFMAGSGGTPGQYYGMSRDQFGALGFDQQMNYVIQYMKEKGLRVGATLGEIYDAIAGYGYRTGSKGYEANRNKQGINPWDTNQDGYVAKGEAVTSTYFSPHIKPYFDVAGVSPAGGMDWINPGGFDPKIKTATQVAAAQWSQDFISNLAQVFKYDPNVDSDCAIIAARVMGTLGVKLEGAADERINAGKLVEQVKASGAINVGIREAMSGDYIDFSGKGYGATSGHHAGIVVGRDKNGNLLILNNPGGSKGKDVPTTISTLDQLTLPGAKVEVYRPLQSPYAATRTLSDKQLTGQTPAPASKPVDPDAIRKQAIAEGKHLIAQYRLAIQSGNDLWQAKAREALDNWKKEHKEAIGGVETELRALAKLQSSIGKPVKPSGYGQGYEKLKTELSDAENLYKLNENGATYSATLQKISQSALAAAKAEKEKNGETAKWRALSELAGQAAEKARTIDSRADREAQQRAQARLKSQQDLQKALSEKDMVNAEAALQRLKDQQSSELALAKGNEVKKAQIIAESGPAIIAAADKIAALKRSQAVAAAQSEANTAKGVAGADLDAIEKGRRVKVQAAYDQEARDRAKARREQAAAEAEAKQSVTEAQTAMLQQTRQYEGELRQVNLAGLNQRLSDAQQKRDLMLQNQQGNLEAQLATEQQYGAQILALQRRSAELTRNTASAEARAAAEQAKTRNAETYLGNPKELERANGLVDQALTTKLATIQSTYYTALAKFEADAVQRLQNAGQAVQDAENKLAEDLLRGRADAIKALSDSADALFGSGDTLETQAQGRANALTLLAGGLSTIAGVKLDVDTLASFGSLADLYDHLVAKGADLEHMDLSGLAAIFERFQSSALRSGDFLPLDQAKDMYDLLLKIGVAGKDALDLLDGSKYSAGQRDTVLSGYSALKSGNETDLQAIQQQLLGQNLESAPLLKGLLDQVNLALDHIAEEAMSRVIKAEADIASVTRQRPLADLEARRNVMDSRDYQQQHEALLAQMEESAWATQEAEMRWNGATEKEIEAERLKHEDRLTQIRRQGVQDRFDIDQGELVRQRANLRAAEDAAFQLEQGKLERQHSLGLISEADYLQKRYGQRLKAAQQARARAIQDATSTQVDPVTGETRTMLDRAALRAANAAYIQEEQTATNERDAALAALKLQNQRNLADAQARLAQVSLDEQHRQGLLSETEYQRRSEALQVADAQRRHDRAVEDAHGDADAIAAANIQLQADLTEIWAKGMADRRSLEEKQLDWEVEMAQRRMKKSYGLDGQDDLIAGLQGKVNSASQALTDMGPHADTTSEEWKTKLRTLLSLQDQLADAKAVPNTLSNWQQAVNQLGEDFSSRKITAEEFAGKLNELNPKLLELADAAEKAGDPVTAQGFRDLAGSLRAMNPELAALLLKMGKFNQYLGYVGDIAGAFGKLAGAIGETEQEYDSLTGEKLQTPWKDLAANLEGVQNAMTKLQSLVTDVMAVVANPMNIGAWVKLTVDVISSIADALSGFGKAKAELQKTKDDFAQQNPFLNANDYQNAYIRSRGWFADIFGGGPQVVNEIDKIGLKFAQTMQTAFSSGISNGLLDAIRTNDFSKFSNKLHEEVFNGMAQGVVDVFMNETLLKNIVAPAIKAWSDALKTPDTADDMAAAAGIDAAMSQVEQQANAFYSQIAPKLQQYQQKWGIDTGAGASSVNTNDLRTLPEPVQFALATPLLEGVNGLRDAANELKGAASDIRDTFKRGITVTVQQGSGSYASTTGALAGG
ncbi:hypothetical protein Dxin01_02772 [Deinococcus xinjiangensis]|uniref:Phage tail tape measure protein domain-containing protein n=1 Tax=Deinococcus xinjiangensis TaxID=457454 RepID=A0ABP9VCQ6_9DEIO